MYIIFSDKDPDSLDPQDFGFLNPDPQKYADPRVKINQKLQKNFFTPKPKSEPKNKKFENYFLFKKISKSLRNGIDSDPD